MSYLTALGLTLVLEIPIYMMGLWGLLGVPPWRGGLAGLGVNLVTHPVSFLWLAPLLTAIWGYGLVLLAIEVLVLLVEAGFLWAWQRKDPGVLLGLSLVANGTSLGIGLLVLH